MNQHWHPVAIVHSESGIHTGVVLMPERESYQFEDQQLRIDLKASKEVEELRQTVRELLVKNQQLKRANRDLELLNYSLYRRARKAEKT